MNLINVVALSAVVSLFMVAATPLKGSKILLMMPFCTKSHRIVLDPIVLELAARGHHVTVFTSFGTIPDSPNVRNVVFESSFKIVDEYSSHYFDGSTPNGMEFLGRLVGWARDMATAVLNEPEIKDILQNPRDAQGRSRFDLLLIDSTLNEFGLVLGQRMGIPSIYLNPLGIYGSMAWNLNIPHPYAAVASIGFKHSRQMNFFDRMNNALENVAMVIYRNYFILPAIDEIVRKAYPEAKPLIELERNVSMILTNSHCSLTAVTPTMPYFVEIGGMHLGDAKPLPQDLEEFMQSSGEHGVIYFSFGTVVSGRNMPWQMRDKFIKAFALLPQLVLWKYDQGIEYLPKNVRLIKFAPQRDLLAHPKLRAFLTHGGGMSIQEAAYYGCPVVAMPLSIDQFGNVANSMRKGFAVSLEWQTFTVEQLVEAFQTVITDETYRNNALKVSTLIKDRPQNPLETAVYWIEYVIRHEGAPHLKSGAEKLNFFQYFLLDAIVVVLLVLMVSVIFVYCVIVRVLRLLGILFCKCMAYSFVQGLLEFIGDGICFSIHFIYVYCRVLLFILWLVEFICIRLFYAARNCIRGHYD